jgi:hypothetical protein
VGPSFRRAEWPESMGAPTLNSHLSSNNCGLALLVLLAGWSAYGGFRGNFEFLLIFAFSRGKGQKGREGSSQVGGSPSSGCRDDASERPLHLV